MDDFYMWLESRAAQVADALDHLEWFPQLQQMSHPEMVDFLSSPEVGYEKMRAAMLAARIGMILRGNITTQDFKAGDADSAAVMNRMMDRQLGPC